jgi:D-3-phosphoglycerate dehydrogenase
MPDAAQVLLSEADVLFIHLCPVSAESIYSAPKLKYIATARGGVENIDLKAAKDREITIINCPAHNAVAVAEYVIGLIICEMRNIARSYLGLQRGEWIERYPNSDAIPELRTCVAGIVGFGTIGRLVAERLRAFETRILVFDPYVCAKEISSAGCEAVGFEELLKVSDIITLHGRLPPETPPLIGRGELAIMKPTAYLINTARASLVDMDAAYIALREGRIRGAAFDVFSSEPLRSGDPMLSLDNVTLTSHRAGDTLNSYILAPRLLLRRLTDSLAKRTTDSN